MSEKVQHWQVPLPNVKQRYFPSDGWPAVIDGTYEDIGLVKIAMDLYEKHAKRLRQKDRDIFAELVSVMIPKPERLARHVIYCQYDRDHSFVRVLLLMVLYGWEELSQTRDGVHNRVFRCMEIEYLGWKPESGFLPANLEPNTFGGEDATDAVAVANHSDKHQHSNLDDED
jgi:hypothetical protein